MLLCGIAALMLMLLLGVPVWICWAAAGAVLTLWVAWTWLKVWAVKRMERQ